MTTFRAAVVQAAPVAFERERTLEKVRALSADAAAEGARLALVPEAFVSAYPPGLDFGARIGMRTPEGREDFRRYIDLDEIARGNYDLGVVGHYARPDIFRLHVNERPLTPVVSNTGEAGDPFAEE